VNCRNSLLSIWRNRSPSGVSTQNGGNNPLATCDPASLSSGLCHAIGCQTDSLMHEKSKTERQRERRFLKRSFISLESGSRLAHRPAHPFKACCHVMLLSFPACLHFSRPALLPGMPSKGVRQGVCEQGLSLFGHVSFSSQKAV
jgi:hypothetical protein